MQQITMNFLQNETYVVDFFLLTIYASNDRFNR
jgi:hypothetical protein